MNTIKQTLLGGLLISAIGNTNAALIAYEGFNYNNGPLAGDNGGTGWNGAWKDLSLTGNNQSGTSDNEVDQDGLTYGNISQVGGTSYLQQDSGNNKPQWGSFRTLSSSVDLQSLSNQGKSLWLSFMIEGDNTGALNSTSHYAGLSFFDGATQKMFFGKVAGQSPFGVGLSESSSAGTSSNTNINNTHFLVYNAKFQSGTIVVDMYTPTQSQVNSNSIGSVIKSYTINDISRGNFTSIRIAANHPQGVYLDEIRMGTSSADVAPVPEPATMTALGAGLALLARKRRQNNSTTITH